ncbi:hypothetical protein [Nocardioides jensenii]|uniref:hypothetical protein n=1 Tax=Nocardioides jensenii TaxID=1843 RepID=UPI00082A4F2C|nr:hypothetical protein [Nocardioides jensenii]
MPRLIDTQTRAASLTIAINHVIATDGTPALSLRRIAEVSRVSPSTMVNDYGSREQLLRIAAHLTANDRLRQFVIGQPCTGLLALLPGSDPEHSDHVDAVVQARVWQGWMELWRSLPGLECRLQTHYTTLQEFLSVLTEGRLSTTTINGILAMSEGLEQQMARPVTPLSPTAARELLARHLRHQGIPAAPVRPGERTPDHLVAAINWMRHSVLER